MNSGLIRETCEIHILQRQQTLHPGPKLISQQATSKNKVYSSKRRYRDRSPLVLPSTDPEIQRALQGSAARASPHLTSPSEAQDYATMKLSTRVIELNCLFLLVVALLVALQLFLQRAQQRLQLSERQVGVNEAEAAAGALLADDPEAFPVHNPAGGVDALLGLPGSEHDVKEESLVAAPFVPNIRKSFPKRKAPYIRKGKNKKKKGQKNKKNKQQKHGSHGGLREEGEGNVGLQEWGKSGNLKKFIESKEKGKAGVKFWGKHGGKTAINKLGKVNGSIKI